MASTTYLQVVNRVLVRLRETEVATVTENSYSTLIGALVNKVKTEIEDAWRWHALRDTYSVNCVDGTTSYVLTGSGPDAVVINAWNASTESEMAAGTVRSFDKRYFGTTTPAAGHPTEYLMGGLDASYDLSLDVWPQPNNTDVLKFNLYKPQALLSSGTDVPLVPIAVLVEVAVTRAMAERGDDGGVATQQQEALYRDLLSSAIARDAGRDETELVWSVI
jgi:hypothetical protein